MVSTSVDRINGARSSLAIKAPCAACTTVAITLSGEQTIDGIACVTGNRVLVKNQASGVDNGVYVCDTGDWDRAPDFDGSADVTTGTMAYVVGGATNGNKFFQVTTTGTIIPGTTSIAFSAVSIAFGSPTANSITYGMIQQVAANSILCNATNAAADVSATALAINQLIGRGSSGNISAIGIGAGLTMTGTTLDITSSTSLPTQTGNGGKFLTTNGTDASWATVVPVLRNYIAGCGIANGTDATNDINFSAGQCTDSTNAVTINCAAMAGKQLDVGWAPGAAAGMRNSGAAITDTTYHLYAVAKADGTQDYYAHTSLTVATVITALQAESGGASYLYARRIASIVRAGGTILAFAQTGDYFRLTGASSLNTNTSNPGTSRVTELLAKVPVGLKVKALVNAGAYPGTNSVSFYLSDLSAADEAPSETAAPLWSVTKQAGFLGACQYEIMTNTSGQIGYRMIVSGASDVMRIVVLGWTDYRGRND